MDSDIAYLEKEGGPVAELKRLLSSYPRLRIGVSSQDNPFPLPYCRMPESTFHCESKTIQGTVDTWDAIQWFLTIFYLQPSSSEHIPSAINFITYKTLQVRKARHGRRDSVAHREEKTREADWPLLATI